MAKFIDAERIPNDDFFKDLTDKEKSKVLQWFIQAPVVDVTPIVRCKDCKFSDCCSIKEAGCTELYDYCSKGKRKEINND